MAKVGRPRKLKSRNVIYVDDEVFEAIRRIKEPRQVDNDVVLSLLRQSKVKLN